MSIKLMISEHPLVGTSYNANLGHAVRTAIEDLVAEIGAEF